MHIDGKTRTLGLIGNPVEHTMSPMIHNSLNEYLNINEVYVPFHVNKRVDEETVNYASNEEEAKGCVTNDEKAGREVLHRSNEALRCAVKGAYDLNILGLNVTVPYKNDVMECLTDIDEGARAIGAVNTLVRTENGYKGYNTDMSGLYRELVSYGVELKDRNVIILGAGGVARAVAYMCAKYGASHTYILNRTLSKATDIADSMNSLFGSGVMEAMNISDYNLLPRDKYIVFQSTSKGLYPNVDDVIISDKNFYELVDVGIDLIYKPFCTRFMTLCKEAGARAYNGLKMLLYQGIIAYELWNDIHVSEDIADRIYGSLVKKARENIILIGFMGSGKTTVGHELSSKYGFDFLDTDKYIEEKCGMSISDIFSSKGEEYFRELETETLRELNNSLTHTVISTGGGLPLRKENAELLSQLGTVVYLDITPESVVKRLAGDTSRPLLAGANPEQKVCELLTARKPIYEDVADITIPVDKKTPEEIVREIANL